MHECRHAPNEPQLTRCLETHVHIYLRISQHKKRSADYMLLLATLLHT